LWSSWAIRKSVRTPLVALQDVPESGWFGRMIDSILLFFHSLFNLGLSLSVLKGQYFDIIWT
jgi:hypothetical protein